MFCRLLKNTFVCHGDIYGNYLPLKLLPNVLGNRKPVELRKYSCCISGVKKLSLKEANACFTQPICSIQKKDYSEKKEQIKEKPTQECEDQEYARIKQLFPQPRVILNEFNAKMPQNIFQVHYKESAKAPRLTKKKKVALNEWTCTYSFNWPEKIKFDGSGLSKREAAEKAATKALTYMYRNHHIDDQGQPIREKAVLREMKAQMQQLIFTKLSPDSAVLAEKLWEEYESTIKPHFEKFTNQTDVRELASTVASVPRDSTVDEVDEYIEPIQYLDNTEVYDPKNHPVFGRNFAPPRERELQVREREIRRIFEQSADLRSPLPIDQHLEEITSKLETNPALVISGAAGCGKSTRVPAAILRHFGAKTSLIVSEPRRVAATGLAERVASEIGERVGESVGYQVRLQSRMPRPPAGGILYCTSGVLLKRLQNNPRLEGCSHVIIDEAHERDLNTDITMLLLKRALQRNPTLKLVIMSATLDSAVFSKYFDNCPIVEVPGNTHPVSIMRLNEIRRDMNLDLPIAMESSREENARPNINCVEVAEVIKAIDRTGQPGAILAFLPGWAEIKQTKSILDCDLSEATHMIVPVHSRVSASDQNKMFTLPMPGIRKIVLATNIAETSVTIPDVVHVVDSGAVKESRVKQKTGTASVETVWVSEAAAKQRTGRAGRVKPGFCYRLYSEEKEAQFQPFTTPEILRSSLTQTVLQLKSYSQLEKAEEFLSQLPEPPDALSVRRAVYDLIDIGALTCSESLTRLGSILSQFPVPPRLGVALLHGAILGSVMPMGNVVALEADGVEVFRDANERKDEIRETKRKFSATSDHVALNKIQDEFDEYIVNNIRGWTNIEDWCNKHGLRRERLAYAKSLTDLHLEQVLHSGIFESTLDPHELNKLSNVDELTPAILLSGTGMLLTAKKSIKTKGKLQIVNQFIASKNELAQITRDSVNHDVLKQNPTAILTYFGGYHSPDRRAVVINNCSLIPPQTTLLFARGVITTAPCDVRNQEGEKTTKLKLLKHNLEIHVPTSQTEHIVHLREMLWHTIQYYIDRNFQELSSNDIEMVSQFKNKLMTAIANILVETKDSMLVKSDLTSKNVEERKLG